MAFDPLTSHHNARSGVDAVLAAADHAAAAVNACNEIRAHVTRTNPEGAPRLIISTSTIREILDRWGVG
jgi:hypothetical protein